MIGKIVKVFFGVLVACYALLQTAFLLSMISGAKPHTSIDLVASGAILCLALAISLALFRSAMSRPKANDPK